MTSSTLNKRRRALFISVVLLVITSLSTAIATQHPPQSDNDASRSEDEKHEDVVVVAEPAQFKRIAGSAHFLDSAQLDLLEYDDIHRVLAQVPGVYVREEDGFGLRPNIGLRGASSDRSAKLTLMEDGVLLGPAPYSAPAAYYFPLMTRITGTEVFKGPASIKHGPSTIGGALNLITRPIPKGSLLALDLAGGQLMFGKTHVVLGYGGKNMGFVLEGVHLRTDGFKQLETEESTGFAKNEVMLKTHYRTQPTSTTFHQIELKLGYSTEISNETYLGLSEDDFAATPYKRYAASANALMDWKRTQASLTHLWGISNSLDIQTTAYRHDFRRAWTKLSRFENTEGSNLQSLLATDLSSGKFKNFYRILNGKEDSSEIDRGNLELGTNDRTFFSQGLQSTLHWRPVIGNIGQEIEAGIRLHQDQIQRNHTSRYWSMTSGELVDTQVDGTPKNNTGKSLALAMYLRDEIEIGDLFITPGIRFESIHTSFTSPDTNTGKNSSSLATQNIFIPGVGFFYQLSSQLGLLGGVYRGFSPTPPGGKVTSASSQDQDPSPEKSINYEGGLRFSSGTSQFEMVGFFNDYSNITAACRLSASSKCSAQNGQQFNGGRVWVYGTEVAAKHQHSLGWLDTTVRLSYTLTMNEFREAFESSFDQYGKVAIGDRLPYVPRHQGYFGVGFSGPGFSHHRWNLELSANYVAQMRDIAGQGTLESLEKIPAHTVLDGVGTYAFSPTSSLYLKVDNLLNETYMVSRRPYGPRPGKPRLVMVGYKHQFSDFL